MGTESAVRARRQGAMRHEWQRYFEPRAPGELTLRLGFPPAAPRLDGTPVPFPPPTLVPVRVR